MLLECANCGAPLDVVQGKPTSRCHYCGTTSRVEQLRTVAPTTPEGWVPPRAWTPPPHTNLPQVPLAFRPVRMLARAISFGASLAFIGIISAVALRMAAVTNPGVSSPLTALGASGNVQNVLNQALGALNAGIQSVNSSAPRAPPIVCRGNESVTLTKQNLTLPHQVSVIATDNCTIRLVDCTANAATDVAASGNASVIAEGGQYLADGPAIVLADNATLDASMGANLVGESTLTVSGNATATLRNVVVTGRHVAIVTAGLSHVTTTGTAIHGVLAGTRRVVHQ
jgi:hypothetical protein